MILDRYIRNIVLCNIIVVTLVLLSCSGVIRLMDELCKIRKDHHSFIEIIIYIFFNFPKDFELFLPISALLGGLLGLGTLEMRNELIIMQVCGFGKLRMIFSVFKASIPILLFNIISNEWILPNVEQGMYKYRNKTEFSEDYTVSSVGMKKLWLTSKNSFICIDNMESYYKLIGINLYFFDKDKKLERVLHSEYAVYTNNIWNLFNVNEFIFNDDIYVFNKETPFFVWETAITPFILSILNTNPDFLSISGLYHCLKYFERIGQNSRYYESVFWNKICSPIVGLVMIVVSLSCTLGPLSKVKINIRLLWGSFIGFVFYISNKIFIILNVVHNLPTFVGIMFSSIIFFIASVYILYKYK